MATRAGEGLWPEPLVLSATKTERALGAGLRRVCDRSGVEFDGPSYAVETVLRLTDRPL